MSDTGQNEIPLPSIQTKELERLVYISLPEETSRHILEDFDLDPSIPLPVEPPPGVDSTQLADLSWEMIVSAMLKICAYQPDHPHMNYFRRFIRAVQFDIDEQMTRMGIVKARNGEFQIAEEIFRALVNFAPEEEKGFINLALVYEQAASSEKESGENEEAERFLQSAAYVYQRGLKFHPKSTQLHYNAGQFFLQRNNLKRAKEHFECYLDLDHEESEKRNRITELLRELANQTQDDSLFSEAYGLIKKGEEKQGIEKIRRFLQRNGEVWNAWFLLGWALRKQESYEKAREAFMKCVELNDSIPDAFNELAICNLELEQYKQAKGNLEKALSLEPENTKVISNLGILALKQGDFELAKRFFLTVIELDPSDTIASMYLDKIDEQS